MSLYRKTAAGGLILLAVAAIGFAWIQKARPTSWRRIDPSHILSREGFRGVKWCTRAGDAPWKWVTDKFPDPVMIRQDEDYTVFGVRAKWITYTTRNSVLYGVRIDIEGREQVERAARQCLIEYPAVRSVATVNALERRWQTPATSVWVTLPDTPGGLGAIYLWGRDRMFADDSLEPRYLGKAPVLNSNPHPYQPRRHVVYRAPGAIRIDGKLDEESWQRAAWSQPFEDHQAPYAAEPWKITRVKILYDDAYLYVGAYLPEENVWSTLTRRDSVVYDENDFEIFVDPTADGVKYFEFEINCLNTAFDMFHENNNYRGALADPTYDVPGLRNAVHVDGTLNYHHDRDRGWSVEVAWPLAAMKAANPSMPFPVGRGQTWRMNFSRVQYLHVYHLLFPYMLTFTNPEDWVWQSTHSGDLHVPEMWGRAVFSDLPAGAKRDEALERLPEFAQLPASRAPRRDGPVHFPAAIIRLGPDPTDPLHSPGHQAEVPAFSMDRYEVTVAEFAAFLNRDGNSRYWASRMQIPELCGIVRSAAGQFASLDGRQNYPVVYVTPDAARSYCESRGGTLPTEAMWERAARGLTGRKYPWGDEPITPERANYDFHYGGTTPVGTFRRGATPEGIYDLAGNVKEWTTSKFFPYPGGAAFTYHVDLWFEGPLPNDFRVFPVNRGGGWTTQERSMPSAYRDAQGDMNAGFRCVTLSH